MPNDAFEALANAIEAGAFKSSFNKKEASKWHNLTGAPEEDKPSYMSSYSPAVQLAANGLLDITRSKIGKKAISATYAHGFLQLILNTSKVSDHGKNCSVEIFEPGEGKLALHGLILERYPDGTSLLGLVLRRLHSFAPGGLSNEQQVDGNEVVMVTVEPSGKLSSCRFELTQAEFEDRLDKAVRAASCDPHTLEQNRGVDCAKQLAEQIKLIGAYLNGIARAAGPAQPTK